MSDGGKGDTQRPRLISQSELARRWEQTFRGAGMASTGGRPGQTRRSARQDPGSTPGGSMTQEKT